MQDIVEAVVEHVLPHASQKMHLQIRCKGHIFFIFRNEGIKCYTVFENDTMIASFSTALSAISFVVHLSCIAAWNDFLKLMFCIESNGVLYTSVFKSDEFQTAAHVFESVTNVRPTV